MLKEILDKQRTYSNFYFNNFHLEQLEKLVDLIFESKGVCFFSGVGKSGLVAEKIALTLVSTGTKAIYLSPINAMHGDIGIVSPGDIFIMLSKSGESDELLQLVPSIRNKGAYLVSIVCTSASRLQSASNLVISLPFQSELCPFDIAPTMSTTFQLLCGDLLAVALMRKKRFTLQDYGLNHPSGRIGKRITLKVKDLMLTGERIPLCKPEEKLVDALTELSNKRCGCLLIIDRDRKLLGIFTDGDLRRSLQKGGSQILEEPISKLMTTAPKAISPEALAWDAMKLMEADYQKRIMLLPVVNEQRQIEGLLHLHDLVQIGI